MRTFIISAIVVMSPIVAFGTIINVPADYATIQEAIDAAANGDTVLVAPGTYVENIDFLGKTITVSSAEGPEDTVIDGNQLGSTVTFSSGSGNDAVLDGFTVTNGSGTFGGSVHVVGGGIYCMGSSPTIRNNVITGNTIKDPDYSGSGGGIYCQSSNSIIICNIISNNTVEGNGPFACQGGGIRGGELIANNIIKDNRAVDAGGGIFLGHFICNNIIVGNEANVGGGILSGEMGFIENNTIVNNTAYSQGGGIFVPFFSTATCSNSILWDNEAPEGPEIYLADELMSYPTLTISYSDLEGGQSSVYVGTGGTLNWGAGMIDADPLFFDPASGDYHLQQDPCQPGIVNPCVDTGSNLVTYNGYYSCSTKTNNDGDEGVVDMGFHYGSYTILDLFLNMDTCFLHQGTGGTVNFKLSAGEDNHHRNYLLLGSASGTEPGFPLPGGLVTLPINWDWFTTMVFRNRNTPYFHDFLGNLDSSGRAEAQFYSPPLPPLALGLKMHFAYCCDFPFDFVSNPIEAEIIE